MERQTVITILESLANGIDPATGNQIPHEPFHTADTVRALFTACTLLKASDGKAAPQSGSRTNSKFASAGMAWSAEEDTRLAAEFDSGMTIAQIGLQHGRTSGAITSRLAKLGRIDPSTVKSRDRGVHAAS